MAKKKRKQVVLEKGAEWLEDIKEQAQANVERSRQYLGYHSLVYFTTNTFLILLNLFLAGGFPWSYFIAVSWGIGYLVHGQRCLNIWRRSRGLYALTHISKEQYALLREYLSRQDLFALHRTAFLSVIASFAGINLIVSPQFLWFLILSAGWGIGIIGHTVWYLVRRTILKKILHNYGITWKLFGRIRVSKKPKSSYAHFFEDANALKKVILNEIRNSARLKARWNGMDALLDQFTSRMRDLVEREKLIAANLESVSGEQIDEELALASKPENTRRPGPGRRAASASDSHKRSILELEERRGAIGLRLGSAFLFLKKIKGEAVRDKNSTADNKPLIIHELEDRSEELTLFLKDLRKNL